MRMATPDGSHPSVVVSDTGRDSRRFARPREPATETAVSKVSWSHASRDVSKTMTWWERCVSSYWRTMSLPRRAVDCQCTARRSSPGS